MNPIARLRARVVARYQAADKTALTNLSFVIAIALTAVLLVGVAGVGLLLPHRLQHAMAERDGLGIADCLAHADDGMGGARFAGGEMLRRELDRNEVVSATVLRWFHLARV